MTVKIIIDCKLSKTKTTSRHDALYLHTVICHRYSAANRIIQVEKAFPQEPVHRGLFNLDFSMLFQDLTVSGADTVPDPQLPLT